jgi:hypothetical protein
MSGLSVSVVVVVVASWASEVDEAVRGAMMDDALEVMDEFLLW